MKTKMDPMITKNLQLSINLIDRYHTVFVVSTDCEKAFELLFTSAIQDGE